MKISVRDLKACAESLFAQLEDTGTHEIVIRDDYYWDTDDKERYDMTQRPVAVEVGQLMDDWSELELAAICRGEVEPMPHAFVRLAAILRYVGEKTVS